MTDTNESLALGEASQQLEAILHGYGYQLFSIQWQERIKGHTQNIDLILERLIDDKDNRRHLKQLAVDVGLAAGFDLRLYETEWVPFVEVTRMQDDHALSDIEMHGLEILRDAVAADLAQLADNHLT